MALKILLLNLSILFSVFIHSQGDTILMKKSTSINTQIEAIQSPAIKKPELFNSGFLDFQNSNQINAAARIFRLYIGDPKKFKVPLSIYSGVSGNNYNSGLSSIKGSEQMIISLINPMSGILNISTDNSVCLSKKNKLTTISFEYQLGEKMVTGSQAITLKNFNYFSTFINCGLLFKTGAWEKGKEKNVGFFWTLLRFHLIQINKSFESLSGYPPDNTIFKGYSIGLGIEINNVLNIKTYYYHYLHSHSKIFNIPIYQLTFNYNLKSN